MYVHVICNYCTESAKCSQKYLSFRYSQLLSTVHVLTSIKDRLLTTNVLPSIFLHQPFKHHAVDLLGACWRDRHIVVVDLSTGETHRKQIHLEGNWVASRSIPGTIRRWAVRRRAVRLQRTSRWPLHCMNPNQKRCKISDYYLAVVQLTPFAN